MFNPVIPACRGTTRLIKRYPAISGESNNGKSRASLEP
jgi:hypothetical protein